MEMWCPDDIWRDSWDWVGPPAWVRACFNSPEWGGGSSPIKNGASPDCIIVVVVVVVVWCVVWLWCGCCGVRCGVVVVWLFLCGVLWCVVCCCVVVVVLLWCCCGVVVVLLWSFCVSPGGREASGCWAPCCSFFRRAFCVRFCLCFLFFSGFFGFLFGSGCWAPCCSFFGRASCVRFCLFFLFFSGCC